MSTFITDDGRVEALVADRLAPLKPWFEPPDGSRLTITPSGDDSCDEMAVVLVQWADDTEVERVTGGIRSASEALLAVVALPGVAEIASQDVVVGRWEFVHTNEMYADDLTDAKRNDAIDMGWPALGTAFLLDADCRWDAAAAA